MALGMVKNDAILRWFLFVLGTDPSSYVREYMVHILGRTLGATAIGEHLKLRKPKNLREMVSSSSKNHLPKLARLIWPGNKQSLAR